MIDFYLILGVTLVVIAFLTKKARVPPKQSNELTPIIKPFNPHRVPNGKDLDDDLLATSPMSESSEDFVVKSDYMR